MTHVIDTTLTRRKAIVAGTTTILGATGLALGSDTAGAQADVDLGELEVEPAELAPEDREVFAPWVLLTGSWEYTVQKEPTEWQAFLLVYDGGGNSEAVALTDGPADAREDTGTYALRGAITATSFYGPEDFTVPEGETSVTRTVPIEVAFVVRDGAGDMLVQARVADDAVVTVTAEGQTVASLSGSGTVVMQDDSGDATPALPEG